MTSTLRGSAVVPAYNEAARIGRTLAALTAANADLDVVVAANGCTDDTVARASQFPVRVLDLPEPGKTAALDAADAVADGCPRLYVDADVELRPGSVEALLLALGGDAAVLAVPRRELDLTGATLLVHAYFRTWDRLQEVRGDLLGCGVYAVNAAGRSRWTTFPAGIADDYYVHSRFTPGERRLVEDAVSVVRPARTLESLLAVRTRVRAGNVEHARQGSPMQRGAANWMLLARDPLAILGLPVYVVVTWLSRRRARRALAAGRVSWGSDATGRAA